MPKNEDIEYSKDGQLIRSVEYLVEVSAVLSGASPKIQVLATKSATSTKGRVDPRELVIPNEIVQAFAIANNLDVPGWIRELLTEDEIQFTREAVKAGFAELAKESLAAILVESELARRFPDRGNKAAWLDAATAWKSKGAVNQPRRGNEDTSTVDLEYVLKNFSLADTELALHIPDAAHELTVEERIAIREDAERRERSKPHTKTPSAGWAVRYPQHRPTDTPTT